MTTLPQFISNKSSYRHHAILLLSNYFSEHSIPDADFKLLIQEFCGLDIYENKEMSVYDVAKQYSDIFIADRERKVLRLEDIKQIREFSLYPPQQATRRLFLIENCERLNANAANSLLKTLEEPPTACLFLLTSSKLSLVLPTISSRVQKIVLSFQNDNNSNKNEIFSAEDLQWIKNKINHFQLKNYLPHHSLNEVNPQAKSQKNIHFVKDVISHCERFAKEYEAEDLRALLVSLLNEKVKLDYSFITVAKFFLANITEWKNSENYHPSTALWLTRLFLLF